MYLPFSAFIDFAKHLICEYSMNYLVVDNCINTDGNTISGQNLLRRYIKSSSSQINTSSIRIIFAPVGSLLWTILPVSVNTWNYHEHSRSPCSTSKSSKSKDDSSFILLHNLNETFNILRCLYSFVLRPVYRTRKKLEM